MISKQMLDDMVGATRSVLGMLKQIQEHQKEAEEKTKRDWEIVAFSAKYWGLEEVRFSRGYDGSYSAGINGVVATEPIEKLLANGSIHSVRRLSDSEVFSIGDEVEYSISGERFVGKIDGFESYEEHMMATGEPHAFRINMRHVQKVVKPKPLFVTEDGVEVFKGQTFYEVCIYDAGKSSWCPIAESVLHEPPYAAFYRYFSTKEAAEEYILLNKPCLSVNDLKGLWCLERVSVEELKELAKSKLSK
jgi:hypothetical protein